MSGLPLAEEPLGSVHWQKIIFLSCFQFFFFNEKLKTCSFIENEDDLFS
jgi:hypothetical protein